ncbi:MAG: cation:proton antiporter subunit C [Acidobacteriota bacterium]|nr:cation:proton antiporter subunit C [Acidobacteriota bacterium]MDE2924084.1 cation:proton antiporter subunit C [Acidobacteriota bacterium]MDE3265046.1 cation:proton antiporter subunit C [Acidobacteriota bacterium]
MTSAQWFSGLWAYWLIIALMMVGLYIVIARDNLIKKVMGLNIFQAAAILFYVTMAKVTGGTAPIVPHDPAHPGGHGEHGILYSNPLPHVLMLTAIVVGVATTALALALAVRIHGDYGTAEEDEAVIYDREHT